MENKLLSKTFLWMFLGLLVTFATGYAVSSNPVMIENVFGGMFYIFIILELVLVLVLSARVMKMSPVGAKMCFLLYSFVSGLTFSSIFIVYNLTSITSVFLISALVFGIMALIGYTTKVDLTKVGFYLMMALIGAIIVMIVNIFLNNPMVDTFISIVCLIVFIGITAYDVQKIKALESSGLPEDNLAIYGALELYLDFINIFLQILELFAKNKD
ncbi:Bax inhibitor-1/YccA family protein [bacterium]|nr:Bax inhibitor-1/YccA family protein [bacterium]